MESLLIQYLPILIFLGIAVVLSVVFIGAAVLVAKQKPDDAKLSAYECGFEAFEDSRSQFDIRFYLVAILFIIFDLEVVFLFAWAVSVRESGWLGFIEISVFIFILIVALVYLWRIGALDWRTEIQKRQLKMISGPGGVTNKREFKL